MCGNSYTQATVESTVVGDCSSWDTLTLMFVSAINIQDSLTEITEVNLSVFVYRLTYDSRINWILYKPHLDCFAFQHYILIVKL